MTLVTFKIISALVILIIAIIGGIWPFFKKAREKTLCIHHGEHSGLDFSSAESFTSGIFLGAALLHMLPDAAKTFINAGYSYPYPFLIAASIFLLLLLLEHISSALSQRANPVVSSIALLTVIMLAIHSLFEGAAVGIAPEFATTLVIVIAILAHKGAAAFALAVNLNKSELGFTTRTIAFSIFAVMTPLGIFAGSWILSVAQTYTLLTPIFSALAAGTFLYIGTLHGLGRASLIKNCCNMKEFFIMLLGFAIMAVVAVWT